jgi:peptidoglycan-associated lipoprotein
MSKLIRVATVATIGAVLFTTGCATRGQLRRGLEEQNAALEAQAAALEAERAERLAGDRRLASDMGTLNTDLAALRTDYGVRIAQLEEGLEFAVPVHFAFDDADVQEDIRPALDRFAELVQRHYPGSMITVEGFADPAGPTEYNRRLSLRRADAVREYLVSTGLPDGQLRSVGYGEDRQVVPGAAGQASGAELNRRVVFVVETPDVASVDVVTTPR